MNYRIYALGLVVGLIAACSVSEMDIADPVFTNEDVFFARIDDETTRVFVDEKLRVLWDADDRVTIFNKYTYNQEYRFAGETGDNSGLFKKVTNDDFVTGNSLDFVYSVYPYQESTKIDNDGVITLTLPSEQKYRENSFGVGSNTMISCTEDNQLIFKNLCGFIVVKLYGEGVSVSSITLTGNHGEELAGKAIVTMSQGGIPSVEMASDATEEVTLICETPVQLGSTIDESTLFWFVVPPTTFENGITITATSVDGMTFQKSSSNTIKLERNRLSNMKALEWTSEYVSTSTYVTIDGLSYKLSPDGSAQVVRQDKSLSGDIVIPERVSYQGMFYVVNSIISPKSTATYGGHTSISADGGAFQGTAITSVVIPSTITSLPSCAFISCGNLTTVALPSTLQSIGFGCFAYCSSLSEIDLPSGVTYLGEWAFGGCRSLKSFVIPSGVTSLSTAVLYQSGLESIEIPASITRLSENCLNTSKLLTVKMYIRDITKVSYLESSFGDISNTDLYVPFGSKAVYQQYYPWRRFKTIIEF